MDGLSPPPLPERPEFPDPSAKPRGSCLTVVAAIVGLLFAILFGLLMIGFIWPLVIGFAILGVIALQYLVWGWWFERIYRSQPADNQDRSA
jgi:ABC-type bacteriocin/lantibiotic exporter with double-glycine peptidase domain